MRFWLPDNFYKDLGRLPLRSSSIEVLPYKVSLAYLEFSTIPVGRRVALLIENKDNLAGA